MDLGDGSSKLGARVVGFGGPPKPTGQRPVVRNDLRLGNWRSVHPRWNGRCADWQSAVQQAARLR